MTSNYDARDAALRGVLIRTTTDDDGRPVFVVLDADGTPSTFSTLADAERAAARAAARVDDMADQAATVAREWRTAAAGRAAAAADAERLADRINAYLPDGCRVDTDGQQWTGTDRHGAVLHPLPAVADALAVWRRRRADDHARDALADALDREGSTAVEVDPRDHGPWWDMAVEWWRPLAVAAPSTGRHDMTVRDGRVLADTMTRRALAWTYGVVVPRTLDDLQSAADELDQARGVLQAAAADAAAALDRAGV